MELLGRILLLQQPPCGPDIGTRFLEYFLQLQQIRAFHLVVVMYNHHQKLLLEKLHTIMVLVVLSPTNMKHAANGKLLSLEKEVICK